VDWSGAVPLARPSTEPGEGNAEQGTGHDVAGIVDARVHARVANQGGQHPQGQGEPRLGAADSDGERESGRGVSGRKRARPRHSRVTWQRALPNGTPAPADRLESGVYHCRRNRNRHEAVGCRAPALLSACDGEQPGRADPRFRVVGRFGHLSHGAVEYRDICAGDRRIHGSVCTLGLGEPVARVHTGGIV
jgi:hypothetical protein